MWMQLQHAVMPDDSHMWTQSAAFLPQQFHKVMLPVVKFMSASNGWHKPYMYILFLVCMHACMHGSLTACISPSVLLYPVKVVKINYK
jgi:hypothetical protein